MVIDVIVSEDASAFMFFCKKNKPKLDKKYPNATHEEKETSLKMEWNHLSSEKKKVCNYHES